MGKEYEVRAQSVEKMNESYEAITIKPVDGEIGVNINATSLYDNLPTDSARTDQTKIKDDNANGIPDEEERVVMDAVGTEKSLHWNMHSTNFMQGGTMTKK